MSEKWKFVLHVKDISEKLKLSKILTLNETYPEDFRASEPNRKGIHNRRSIVPVAASVAEAAARAHRHHKKGGVFQKLLNWSIC